jgi:kelch-like protein 19
MSLRTRLNIGSRRWPFALPAAVALTLVSGTMASAAATWTTLATAPTNRDDLGAAAAPCPGGTIALGCVYVEAGGGPGTTNEIYSTFTNIWSTGAPLPTAREGLGVVAARCASGQTGTCIYAIDGENGDELNTNEAYRPNSNIWTSLTSAPSSRADVGAAAAPCPGGTIPSGCVYVVDGQNDGTYLSTNEAYNTFNNTWSTLTADPVARQSPMVASGRCPLGQSGTCIYVFGGYNGVELNTAESFNPKTNLWTTLPNLLTARDSGGAAATPCPGGTIAGGCIHVVDGEANNVVMNTVEAYNTWNNTWFTETSDPIARSQLAVVAARAPSGGSGTRVYAIDGHDTTATKTNVNEALTP